MCSTKPLADVHLETPHDAPLSVTALLSSLSFSFHDGTDVVVPEGAIERFTSRVCPSSGVADCAVWCNRLEVASLEFDNWKVNNDRGPTELRRMAYRDVDSKRRGKAIGYEIAPASYKCRYKIFIPHLRCMPACEGAFGELYATHQAYIRGVPRGYFQPSEDHVKKYTGSVQHEECWKVMEAQFRVKASDILDRIIVICEWMNGKLEPRKHELNEYWEKIDPNGAQALGTQDIPLRAFLSRQSTDFRKKKQSEMMKRAKKKAKKQGTVCDTAKIRATVDEKLRYLHGETAADVIRLMRNVISHRKADTPDVAIECIKHFVDHFGGGDVFKVNELLRAFITQHVLK